MYMNEVEEGYTCVQYCFTNFEPKFIDNAQTAIKKNTLTYE